MVQTGQDILERLGRMLFLDVRNVSEVSPMDLGNDLNLKEFLGGIRKEPRKMFVFINYPPPPLPLFF